MHANKNGIGSDLAKIDSREPTEEDYDDIPEVTDEDFQRGRWHVAGVPVAGERGIPVGLDPEVVRHFRPAGPDWQNRINDILRKAAGL